MGRLTIEDNVGGISPRGRLITKAVDRPKKRGHRLHLPVESKIERHGQYSSMKVNASLP